MKTAFVTGATGAIGQAIARQLADAGYHVVVVCRNEMKGRQAVEEIKAQTGNPDIEYALVDLSRKISIGEFAQSWNRPLHVLVNNAGATPRRREETPEGIEMQFATNVLGYFWMTRFFEKHLKEAVSSRVVNVASYWAGNLSLDDLEFTHRHYNNDTAYRQSKQADRMLTVAFARRLAADGITVNACHPGDVNSTLSNNLGYGGHETPGQGAANPVWVATAPELQGVTGRYYEHLRELSCPFGKDLQAVEQLYEICEGY